ncbi:hypothetical protein [Acaryochloris marina]|uniref:hypothetical protein n=1 Tax=Acaryochloris marina TaxID=155978 RepID=UPI0021C384D4|nr:hypothetical protein [Acaryochloris marina]
MEDCIAVWVSIDCTSLAVDNHRAVDYSTAPDCPRQTAQTQEYKTLDITSFALAVSLLLAPGLVGLVPEPATPSYPAGVKIASTSQTLL